MAPQSRTRRLAAALLLALLPALPALPAAAQGSPGANDDAPSFLERMLQANIAREQYIAQTLAPLRSFDTDQNGLDAAEIDGVEDQRLASMRANQMQTLLRYDLDWDGRVTREEVARVAAASRFGHGRILDDERQQKLIDKAVERVMQADADGDGVVTLEEMRVQQAKMGNPERGNTERARALLALDPDKDGHLTADELTRLAEEAFARYDTDGSGVLSAEEVAPLVERVRRDAALRRALAGCDLPKAAAGEQVAMLGIYEGRSVPSVAIAGPDVDTSTGKVIVDSGEKPLYLVLASYDSMIWQLEGDTARVARAVVFGRQRHGVLGSGVTGLPKERVTFVDSGKCKLAFHDLNSKGAVQARDIVARAAGKPVDSIAGTYGLLTVRMPSGQPVKAPTLERKSPAGVPADLWNEYVRFTPGGLNPIDPATVVSPGSAQTYDVLPSQAGLVQLVQDGAIEALGGDKFRIARPIARYPAGLYGAHSVTFILARGVPVPAGSPGHSCVFSEETGLAVTRQARCVLR